MVVPAGAAAAAGVIGHGTVRSHLVPSGNLSQALLGRAAGPAYVGSKVIGTIGPASQSVETLVGMLKAGMTVARVDLTWGSLAFHKQSLHNMHEAMRRCRKLCAIMVDTLGRETMVQRSFEEDAQGWSVHAEPLTVLQGEQVVLLAPSVAPSHLWQAGLDVTHLDPQARVLSITRDDLPGLVQPTDVMYMGRYLACGATDTGSLYLEVLQSSSLAIVCVAQNDADLSGLVTVFHLGRAHGLGNLTASCHCCPLPNRGTGTPRLGETPALRTPSEYDKVGPVLSEYDKTLIQALGEEFELDFLSLSFCQTETDVYDARKFLDSVGLNNTQVVAKIETHAGLINHAGILESSQAILISRGLLGLEIAPEKMALVQKALITAANLLGKPVIISRVLDTMCDSPRPTRAEATDTANLVLDGADGLLLGAETLRGRFPVETVRVAVQICREAERCFDFQGHYEFLIEAAMAAAGQGALLASLGVVPDNMHHLSPGMRHLEELSTEPDLMHPYAMPLPRLLRPAMAKDGLPVTYSQSGAHITLPGTGLKDHPSYVNVRTARTAAIDLPSSPLLPKVDARGRLPAPPSLDPISEAFVPVAQGSTLAPVLGQLKSRGSMSDIAGWGAASEAPERSTSLGLPPPDVADSELAAVVAPGTPPGSLYQSLIHATPTKSTKQGNTVGFQLPMCAAGDSPPTGMAFVEESSSTRLGPLGCIAGSSAASVCGSDPGSVGTASVTSHPRKEVNFGAVSHTLGTLTPGTPAKWDGRVQSVRNVQSSPDTASDHEPALPALAISLRNPQTTAPAWVGAAAASTYSDPHQLGKDALKQASPPLDQSLHHYGPGDLVPFNEIQRVVEAMLTARLGSLASGPTPPDMAAPAAPALPPGSQAPAATLVEKLAGVDEAAMHIAAVSSVKQTPVLSENTTGGVAYMSRVESIASSAVRAAEKIRASLIVVLTHTSRVPQLVAKYRPPMPILTLVIPQLVSDGLHWTLEGRAQARQCLLTRGLLPMLSAPGPTGDEVLEEAIATASQWGLVRAGQWVVVVERIHDDFAVKVVAADDLRRGGGIRQVGGEGKLWLGGMPIPRRSTMVSPGLGAGVTTRGMFPGTPMPSSMVGRTLSMMHGAPSIGRGVFGRGATSLGSPSYMGAASRGSNAFMGTDGGMEQGASPTAAAAAAGSRAFGRQGTLQSSDSIYAALEGETSYPYSTWSNASGNEADERDFGRISMDSAAGMAGQPWEGTPNRRQSSDEESVRPRRGIIRTSIDEDQAWQPGYLGNNLGTTLQPTGHASPTHGGQSPWLRHAEAGTHDATAGPMAADTVLERAGPEGDEAYNGTTEAETLSAVSAERVRGHEPGGPATLAGAPLVLLNKGGPLSGASGQATPSISRPPSLNHMLTTAPDTLDTPGGEAGDKERLRQAHQGALTAAGVGLMSVSASRPIAERSGVSLYEDALQGSERSFTGSPLSLPLMDQLRHNAEGQGGVPPGALAAALTFQSSKEGEDAWRAQAQGEQEQGWQKILEEQELEEQEAEEQQLEGQQAQELGCSPVVGMRQTAQIADSDDEQEGHQEEEEAGEQPHQRWPSSWQQASSMLLNMPNIPSAPGQQEEEDHYQE